MNEGNSTSSLAKTVDTVQNDDSKERPNYGLFIGIPIAAVILISACYVGYQISKKPKKTTVQVQKPDDAIHEISTDEILLYKRTSKHLSPVVENNNQKENIFHMDFDRESQSRSHATTSLINDDGSLRESKLLPLSTASISFAESII
jgi:hypothetical protein